MKTLKGKKIPIHLILMSHLSLSQVVTLAPKMTKIKG